MMGHKDKLINGLEYDVILSRRYYCYLYNNSKLKSYAKNNINRRSRRLAKKAIEKEAYLDDAVQTDYESKISYDISDYGL